MNQIDSASKFNLLSQYNEQGFCVIDELAHSPVAKELRKAWINADYDYIVQKRTNHYGHVFNIKENGHPDDDEQYIARFHRSTSLLRNPLVDLLVRDSIKPLIDSLSLSNVDETFSLFAYKMEPGDVFRSHVDDYVGRVGFIYYLCERWKWDWGGVLCVQMNGQLISTLPRFNRLVIINHGLRLPHFVSMVADYALEPRFMLVGIIETMRKK
jgi:hypothetical protein